MTRLATELEIRPNFWQNIKNFLRNNAQVNELYSFFKNNIIASYTREEGIAHLWMGVLLIESLALFFLNATVWHFTSMANALTLLATLPGFILWWVIGHSHRLRWPRFGLVGATFGNIGICTVIFLINWSAIASTPFVIIDYHLVKWDHLLGFDVITFMAWVHSVPHLFDVFWNSYNTWEYQIFFTPICLALLKRSKEINRFFISSAICLLICNLIYYFFPTIAPAGILHSPYFIDPEYHLATRFYEIHQSLPITNYDGGMVSFPSGHVMYALLILVAWRKVKVVFYPLLVLNTLLIIGTMAIGAHYLVDVIASFIIVAGVLTGMHYFLDVRPNRARLKTPAQTGLPSSLAPVAIDSANEPQAVAKSE